VTEAQSVTNLMKPEDIPDCIGKTLASQNDLLVTEHEKAHAEAIVAYYVQKIARLKTELEQLQELLKGS
jgi:hypothetical protein